jgi:glycosyltransferase involved in cell wall biosynthesis
VSRRVAYVLDRPDLGGGVKVVFQHAALLRTRGHEAVVIGQGPAPDWTEAGVPYFDASRGWPDLPGQDLVVATWWTTLASARAWDRGPVVHFCQGYEGDLVHLARDHPAIEQAYAEAGPAFTVTPALADRLAARFGREAFVVSPPVDPRFRPRWRFRPRRRPRLFLPGIYEAEVKGVEVALDAMVRLRAQGLPFELVRLSVLPLSEAERRRIEPDRYFHAVRPEVVADELPRSDLLISASRAGEGFGLPVLEAMASGVPVAATRIPATEFVGGGAIALVPPDDAHALAAAALSLLRDPGRWRRARRAGLREARRFAPRRVARDLEAAIEWAVARLRRGTRAGGPPA